MSALVSTARKVVRENFVDNADAVIHCGDAFATCATLPPNKFRLIVSSPPYNIGKMYEKQTSLDHYLKWQEELAQKLVELLVDNGSLVWQVGNYVDNGEVFPLDIYFYPIFKNLGLKLRNRIVWHFDHGLHASKRFSGRYEVMLWFTKSDEYIFNLDNVRVPSKYPGKTNYKPGENYGKLTGNPLGKNPSDFWTLIQNEFDCGIIDIPNVKSNHPEKTTHPCQFPIELIERCVLSMTNKGDWVLDPFGGVGATVVAAVKHNRKGMVIDRDAGYCAMALERIQRFIRGELKTRPLGKPIHKPSGREKVAQVPMAWLRAGGYSEQTRQA